MKVTSFFIEINADGRTCTTVNPYSHFGNEKPSGYVECSYDGGKTFDDHTEWAETRHCMMAGIAGGFGYFSEGWATSSECPAGRGLIADPPDFWRYIHEIDAWEQAESERQTFDIDYSGVSPEKKKLLLNGYLTGTTHEADIVGGKAVIK